MKSKKSLVIISFAFIFLLTLSVVSAGLFSRKTGNALRDVQPVGDTLGVGESTTFDGGSVTITDIDSNTGEISGTLTTSSGTQTFSLAEGQTSTAVGGIQISAGNIGGGGLFGTGLFGGPSIPIDITPTPTRPPIEDGGEDFGGTGFGGEEFGGSSCEFIEEEEAFLGLGEESFINNHIIYLDEEGGLTVDDTYSYPPLRDGGNYLVPIPNPECHWEASFEDGGLYMLTVCPVPEEEF